MNANSEMKASDYASDQEVRWCPGCGDYAILKAVQKTLAKIQARKENTVFVSGIGCSSRFPYYLDTYGFHTLHGRAPAVASGVKLANPDLDVWVVTGDGDGLSIGGNHLLHLLRRNVDLQVLLLNNEIYGLTKGQYSPTSQQGLATPSSPNGAIEMPLNPLLFALSAGASFVACGLDTQQKPLVELMQAAHAHKGTAFVEIKQNCIVFNDGVFSHLSDKKNAQNHVLSLKAGEPLRYGNYSLRFNVEIFALERIETDCLGESEEIVHDPSNKHLAQLLLSMDFPGAPQVQGVVYQEPRPTHNELLMASLGNKGAVSGVWQSLK